MTADNLTYGAGFFVGLATFFSPCILPVIPSYLSFLTGISTATVMEGGGEVRQRWRTFLHGLMFVVGFSVVFVLLYGGAGQAVRGVFVGHKDAVAKVGGGIIILFGIYLTGLFKFGFLERERRFQLADKPLGYLGSGLVGLVFAFGWTPCLGPALVAVLTFAASNPHGSALAMMSCFALGLAVPFLVVTIGLNRFLGYFTALKRYSRAISVLSGVILIAAGVGLIGGWFERASALVSRWGG